jgi:hypothetical protein
MHIHTYVQNTILDGKLQCVNRLDEHWIPLGQFMEYWIQLRNILQHSIKALANCSDYSIWVVYHRKHHNPNCSSEYKAWEYMYVCMYTILFKTTTIVNINFI